MSNPTGAFGLRPIYRINGGNIVTKQVYIAATYATALFVGSPVMWTAATADQDPTGKMPSMKIGGTAAGSIYDGVIHSFEPLQSDLSKLYNPASTARIANVCMDPNVVYAVRGDGGGTVTKVFPGQNAIMIATSAGSTVTGLCGWHLDEGTGTPPTTTQNLTLRIIALQSTEDNELGDNAVYEVMLNTAYLAAGSKAGITAQ